RSRRQEGERDQGRSRTDRSGPEGSQGAGRRRSGRGEGRRFQGRSRSRQEGSGRSRRQGRAQVSDDLASTAWAYRTRLTAGGFCHRPFSVIGGLSYRSPVTPPTGGADL